MTTAADFPPVFEDKLNALPETERDTVGRELSDARSDELAQNPVNGNYDLKHLAAIHKHLFQDVSTHAGVVRGYGMSKGASQFADPAQMAYLFDKELPERIESLRQAAHDKERYTAGMTDLHSTLDLAHPFREGNGRATRAFMSQLAKAQGYALDFSRVKREQWVEACIESINSGRETLKQQLFRQIVTRPRAHRQSG